MTNHREAYERLSKTVAELEARLERLREEQATRGAFERSQQADTDYFTTSIVLGKKQQELRDLERDPAWRTSRAESAFVRFAEDLFGSNPTADLLNEADTDNDKED